MVPAEPDIAVLRRRIAAIEGRLEAGARLDLAGCDGTVPALPAGPEGYALSGAGRPERSAGGQAGSELPVSARPGSAAKARSAGRPAGLAFGVAGLDGCFRAGGLPLGALHEMVAPETREAGALAGFAAALVARLIARRPGIAIWVADRASPSESGRLHAPGLHALGLDPGRVVLVAARDAADVLWVMEEALKSRGVAAVLAEIRGAPRALDLTATRRLALRAQGRAVAALLLRTDAVPEPTAAVTRWHVAARPAATAGGFSQGVGRPAWRVDLVKNREGRLGGWNLDWTPHERRFDLLPPDPVARPAAPADRPADPGRTGQVVALKRAS